MQITGQYLIQSESGRPAGHVLGILVRILIHCRVSFEFLFSSFWHAKMETRSKLLKAHTAAWPRPGLSWFTVWLHQQNPQGVITSHYMHYIAITC